MSFKPAAWPRKLRSQEWFGGTTKDAIYHRGWMKNQGFPPDLFDGRPVIGILNTWSELTPCNAHLRDLAERVKHGIYEAGGFPVEVPVFSASESAFRPTAMMFRNLAAMAVEEAMRGQPMDGCVLMVGCDKTTPSLLMAAASTDIPSIVVTGGPMLNGYYKNERVGSGTHLWKFSEAVKAGTMTKEEFMEAEDLSEIITEMRQDTVEDLVQRHLPPKAYAENWDIDGLLERTENVLGLTLPLREWAAEDGIANEEMQARILAAADERAATRLAELLEQHGIAFEIETDQHALSGSNDFSGLQFGVNPESAKILIFVTEPDLARAEALVRQHFPA